MTTVEVVPRAMLLILWALETGTVRIEILEILAGLEDLEAARAIPATRVFPRNLDKGQVIKVIQKAPIIVNLKAILEIGEAL